jgi:ABC-type multidrug transport system permease subunit
VFDFSFDIASKATDTSVVRGIMCVSIAGFCSMAFTFFIVGLLVDIIVNLFLLLLGIDLGLLLGIDQGLLKDLCLLLLLQILSLFLGKLFLLLLADLIVKEAVSVVRVIICVFDATNPVVAA